MPETAKRTARVPILGEDGRISDDYVPAAIGEGVESAEAAAKRAETAATNAEGSATAARQSAKGAQGSAAKAQEGATAASGAVTQVQSAQKAAEAAKTGAESARDSARTAASQAKQSATAAAKSAANVADKFIASAQATTLEPGSEATASVTDQVLTIGVPRGEKGDKGDTGDKGDPGDVSAVQTVAGSDLSVSTDGGTVTIDDSALRARIAELENQSANVVTGTSTGLVAHGEDAYAQKPREVRVKGKTWVNRWPKLNATGSGVTISTADDGLITISGTPTSNNYALGYISNVKPGSSVTMVVSESLPTGVRAILSTNKEGVSQGDVVSSSDRKTGTIPSDAEQIQCTISVENVSETLNVSFRVMLVDGTEAPDCFTPPASITSAQPGNLVTAGKNLLPSTEITKPTNNNAYAAYDGMLLHPGSYTITCDSVDKPAGIYVRRVSDNSKIASNTNDPQTPTFSFTLAYTEKVCFEWYFAAGDTTANGVSNPMLELGSTATAYEPPTVTTTALPEVELRSLPNGTCDELVIKADGTCEVERKTGYIASYTDEEVTGEYVSTGNGLEAGASIVYELDEPTTEPQSPVTLPTLPAPTFNQYHDADVPSDTSTEYARDINLVLVNLESVQAALLGGE